MNQVGVFELGSDIFLRSYQIDDRLVFAPESRKFIAQIVDFNLKQACGKLIYLKHENKVKYPFFFKIHALFLATSQILKKTDFYFCILKVTYAALVVFQVLVIQIVVYGTIIVGLIAAGVYLNLLSIMAIGAFINVLSLFDLFEIGYTALNNFSLSLYLFSQELFKEAAKELKPIWNQFSLETKYSYHNSIICLQDVSSHALEKEAILNKGNYCDGYIDPISKKKLKLNLGLAQNFRLGRFIVSVASLTRYLIESSSQDPKNVSDIAHPVFNNRVLSATEKQTWQFDFSNFFSCHLGLLQDIFEMTLTAEEEKLFPKKEAVNALIYIKATLFYEYIACGHPSFAPEKILKKNIMNEMCHSSKKHLFKLLESKKMFFVLR